MAFSRSRINQAKLLLAVPDKDVEDNKEQAKSLIRSMNHYYFSPVFALSHGYSLKHQLEEKYNISDSFKCCDVLTNLITVPFTDEIFVGMTFVTGVIMFCMILIPYMQAAAYSRGYNTVYGTDGGPIGYGNSIAYDKGFSVDSDCHFCTQEIDCYSANSTRICNVGPIQGTSMGADNVVECPLISASGIAAVQNASSLGVGTYVDPESFVDDVYMTYTMWGYFDSAQWYALRCNRTWLAEKYASSAKNTWIWAMIGFIIAFIAVYTIIHFVFYCCHPIVGELYPENYRLVRINTDPYKPITKSMNV